MCFGNLISSYSAPALQEYINTYLGMGRVNSVSDDLMIRIFSARAGALPAPPANLLNMWMRQYGLFQGVNAADTNTIVNWILGNIVSPNPWVGLSPRRLLITTAFDDVLNGLYGLRLSKQRAWMSLASKVLWLRFPGDFVIYDSFAERAIAVLQGAEPALSSCARLGKVPPGIVRGRPQIGLQVNYYTRYDDIVYSLYLAYFGSLGHAIAMAPPGTSVIFYPIRVLDTILWFSGNPEF